MKIVHDVHTHNVLSHCCNDRSASTEAYIAKELEIGNRVFGLSNHIWDERVEGASHWYLPQTISLAEEAKAALRKERDGIRCLFGAETEFAACKGIVGMSVEGAKRFDYMLVPHSHLHGRNETMWDYPEIMEARKMVESKIRESCPFFSDETIQKIVNSISERRLMCCVPEIKTNIAEYTVRAAINNFYDLVDHKDFIEICKTVPTSIAHPFNLCGVHNSLKNEYLRLIDDVTLEDCFAKAKRVGAYAEINIGSVLECGEDLASNELMRVFAIAKRVGCKFTFGSDTHSTKGLEIIRFGNDVCDYLGLTRRDIAPYLAEDGVID